MLRIGFNIHCDHFDARRPALGPFLRIRLISQEQLNHQSLRSPKTFSGPPIPRKLIPSKHLILTPHEIQNRFWYLRESLFPPILDFFINQNLKQPRTRTTGHPFLNHDRIRPCCGREITQPLPSHWIFDPKEVNPLAGTISSTGSLVSRAPVSEH